LGGRFQQQVGKATGHLEVGRLLAAEVGFLQPGGGGCVVALRENRRLGGQIAFHKTDSGAQQGADEFEQVDRRSKLKLFRYFKAPGAASTGVTADAVKCGVTAIEVGWDAQHEDVQAHAFGCCSHTFEPEDEVFADVRVNLARGVLAFMEAREEVAEATKEMYSKFDDATKVIETADEFLKGRIGDLPRV
jgi:hypothetical protein